MITHLDNPNEREKHEREAIARDSAIIVDRLNSILDYVEDEELEALAVDKNTGTKSLIKMSKKRLTEEEFAAHLEKSKAKAEDRKRATVFQSPGFERHGGGSLT